MARPLKIYMRGKSVRTLQGMLRQMGYPMEDQPAIFGASTRDAVKDFQKRKGLKDTGIVDDELFALMQQSVGFQAEKSDKAKQTEKAAGGNDSRRLDALIGLLISKGILSEEEIGEMLAPQPSAPAAARAKKTPGTPLF